VFAWIGAGLACELGYPSWGDLIGQLVKRCQELSDELGRGPADIELARDIANRGDLTLAADQCRRILGEERFVQAVTDQFDITESETGIRAYEDLLYTPFSGYLTTNYNVSLTRIAHSLANSDPRFERPLDAAYPNLSPATLRQRSTVYLHGNIYDARQLILGEESFGRAYSHEPRLTHLLTQVFSSYSVLLIGTSLDDRDFRRVLLMVRSMYEGLDPLDRPTHYLVTPYYSDIGQPGIDTRATTFRLTPLYYRVDRKQLRVNERTEVVYDRRSLYQSIHELRTRTDRFLTPRQEPGLVEPALQED